MSRTTNRFAYTPYGYHNSALTSASTPGFAGQRLDALINGYPLGNGYRIFSPVLARFLSPDSFSPFGENTRNAYVYCIGDPINAYDPSGHIPVFRTKAYYRTKATRALNKDPNLKKQYGHISEINSARKKHYKAIYKIYKLEKSSRAYEEMHFEELQRGDYGIDVQTALDERARRQPSSDSGDFPLAASMDSDDALRYRNKQRKIETYVARLEEFDRDLHSVQLAAIELRNQS